MIDAVAGGVTDRPAVACARLTADQYGEVASWLAEPQVNRWLYAEWRERPVDERLIALAARGARNAMWLCTVDQAPYGLVAVGGIAPTDRSGVLWYVRNPFATRRPGAMSACVAAAVRTAFDALGLHSLQASVQSDNQASEALLRTVGFQFVGVRREAFHVDSRFIDARLFDLLPGEIREPA